MENISLDYVVKVHPVCLYQIVDAYERRNEDSQRVIGTLLGVVDKGVVEVTNCFCVLHKEYEDQVEADLGYATELGEQIKRVTPNEEIVGWWATGNEVTNHSSVIHEYYSRECKNPVHLLLDTTLSNMKMALRAYVCVPIGVPGGKMGSMFTRIEVEILSYVPEAVAMHLCKGAAPFAADLPMTTSGEPVNPRSMEMMQGLQSMNDLVQVGRASHKLTQTLNEMVNYVDDVLAGRRKADNAVGRALLDIVMSVPHMDHEQFSEMFNSNIKDLLMVTTVSQMMHTQLQLNEKVIMLTSL